MFPGAMEGRMESYCLVGTVSASGDRIGGNNKMFVMIIQHGECI